MRLALKIAASAACVVLVACAVTRWRQNRHETPPDFRNRAAVFTGASVCAECHAAQFDEFRHTAHYHTSRLPEATTIAPNFAAESATMATGNPNLWFEMNADARGFFQTAVRRHGDQIARRTERIDLVIGSGKLGQSYLYWRGDELLQLPVSFDAAGNNWVNSPGFEDGTARFDRPITPRCLECHATYFQVLPARFHYARDNFVLGISCERCHGPGGDHVSFHRQHPEETASRHIMGPGQLSHARQIDLCAQCHAGAGEYLKRPFSYRPGDILDESIALEYAETQSKFGVHSSNQLPRLLKSRCFRESKTMTCLTCHDPHVSNRGNLRLFSKRCLSCHDYHRCRLADELGDTIKENCIDCHMPKQQDKRTTFESESGYAFPLLRDHFIKSHPEAL